jgi:hypothetical protein
MLTGSSDDQPLSKNNNSGFFHDDPANAGVRELRTIDYLNDSLTWNDGAAFLASFNTPVRETVDNTAVGHRQDDWHFQRAGYRDLREQPKRGRSRKKTRLRNTSEGR